MLKKNKSVLMELYLVICYNYNDEKYNIKLIYYKDYRYFKNEKVGVNMTTNTKKEYGIIKGGFISSLSLFLTKFLGIIYIIPLNIILGTAQNRDYYSVGFRVYEIILSVSISGFPLAVATLVSRYEAQGNYEYARLVKKYSGYVMSSIGFVMMLIMMFFAETLAQIIRNPATPEVITTIAWMIRILAVAIFIVSILGNLRGFYQGIKQIKIYSFSQFIEQVVRISIIVFGGFIVVYLLKLDRIFAVYLTAAAAGLSAIVAYLILFFDYNKRYKIKVVENDFHKQLRKQIVSETLRIAFPYMLMSLLAYGISITELTLFNRTFESLGYEMEMRQKIFSAITLQAEKLATIPLVVATGFSVAILPYLNAELERKNYAKMRKQIVDVISTVLLVGLPLCFGLLLYAKPIFFLFFGQTAPEVGVPILQVEAIVVIFQLILNICVAMGMAINIRKYVLFTYIFSIGFKLAWYYPFAVWFKQLGPLMSTGISMLIQITLILLFLKMKYRISLTIVWRRLAVILMGISTMTIFAGLYALIPLHYSGYKSLPIVLICLAIFGGASLISYISFVSLFKLPNHILGIDPTKFLMKLRGSK